MENSWVLVGVESLILLSFDFEALVLVLVLVGSIVRDLKTFIDTITQTDSGQWRNGQG